MEDPISALSSALESIDMATDGTTVAGHSRPDYGRHARKGVPEIILATNKSPEQVADLVEAFVSTVGRAVVSEVNEELVASLAGKLSSVQVDVYRLARMAVFRRPDAERPRTGGKVGIITAGTSDLPYAEQASIVAGEMGCETKLVSDVGVAGIHRLMEPLRDMLKEGVDVIVVAAGMDGALPSVVAGLVDLPVIGLPTSTGYGLGGKGVAALLSMLQTCSPGLTVVNIDNGVGAGASAALIANRVAASRRRKR